MKCPYCGTDIEVHKDEWCLSRWLRNLDEALAREIHDEYLGAIERLKLCIVRSQPGFPTPSHRRYNTDEQAFRNGRHAAEPRAYERHIDDSESVTLVSACKQRGASGGTGRRAGLRNPLPSLLTRKHAWKLRNTSGRVPN